VSSDPLVRLCRVQEQEPHRSAAPGVECVLAEIEETRRLTPVLMFNGVRVYDECDIPALIAFAEISLLLDQAAQGNLRMTPGEVQNASDRHLLEQGHRLQFGCCARESERAA